ncbi:MAG: TolB family protein [Acidobacteriaceae bacterium]|nr:TolB family protein [Acidobacteriaceae bacterium]
MTRVISQIAAATVALFISGSYLPSKQDAPAPDKITGSRVSVYNLQTDTVDVIYRDNKLIEAPNWSPDGKRLLVNTGGELYTLPMESAKPKVLTPVSITNMSHCNNDKGYSPDGTLIAFSASNNAAGSQIFTVAAEGGVPKRIVAETPSYFHAFSPDGQWMAFVAKRQGENFNLFRVPTAGGKQQQLTFKNAYDDGPDYSPDGQWIYFNSNRSGGWDIWRIPAQGAGADDAKAEQVTNDGLEDWFPHCSPDGKHLLFLSFPHGTANHDGHTEVQLRMIPLPGAHVTFPPIHILATFFGGQGTINVNSWSPDSTKFAFVSYEH